MLEDEAGCQGRHGSIAKLAAAERLLSRDLVGDVDDEADHPRGFAVGIAVGDAASIQGPAPGTVRVFEAVLRFEGLFAAGDDFREGGFHALQVIGVNAFAPGIDADRILAGSVTQHPEVELGAPGLVLGEIVIPHPSTGALEGDFQVSLFLFVVGLDETGDRSDLTAFVLEGNELRGLDAYLLTGQRASPRHADHAPHAVAGERVAALVRPNDAQLAVENDHGSGPTFGEGPEERIRGQRRARGGQGS